MLPIRLRHFLPVVFFGITLCAEETSPTIQLFNDLKTVEGINKKFSRGLPTIINYQLQGGYFNMPSARTFDAGILGFGSAYVPPTHIWSLAFQFFNHLETTANYFGFSEFANRAANVKLVVFRKDKGSAFLPNLAFGVNDLMGTCNKNSFYAVATGQFLPLNLEMTLGWGGGNLRGLFGGMAITPFRKFNSFLNEFSIVGEYDATNYKTSEVKNRFNAGAQLKLWDFLRFSGSTLRGKHWAGSIAANYNLGTTKGFLAKTNDPCIYSSPVDNEPIGVIRSRQELVQELAYAFSEQGFDLYKLYLIPQLEGKDHLWMKVVNVRYRYSNEVRRRIEHVLYALLPQNVTEVTVVTEAEGVPIQEYRFHSQDIKRFGEGFLSEEEFALISPGMDVVALSKEQTSALLYKRTKPIWLATFRPWFRSFLGSNFGKFKYEVGLALNPEGYLFDEIYYNISGTYTIKSSGFNIDDSDDRNPSYLLNVRTDSLDYNKTSSFHLEQAYLQKSWNLGKGYFSRVSLGYFETAYLGAALEALYYPVRSNWAFGLSFASLLKRSYFGLGYERKVRKYTNNGPIYVPYVGIQYFFDLYYQFRPLNLDFKISTGQFLAKDLGARFEGGRTFNSGLRVGVWYTLTNANDKVNGDVYFDRGFSITMPLDFFMRKSSRSRIGYAMSALLRDCGASAATGKQLYPTLFWERQK